MRELGESHLYQEIIVDGGVDTVSKAFEYAVTKYGNKECLGTRKVLGNTKYRLCSCTGYRYTDRTGTCYR